jgi:hypothetical protein
LALVVWLLDLLLEEGEKMGDIFESAKRGMEEAIAHSRGDTSEVRLFVPEEANVRHMHEQSQKQAVKDGGENFHLTFTNRTIYDTLSWT